jgi:polyisoprenyl-teichoic acid--peptidoglycan teichoic acid transferase
MNTRKFFFLITIAVSVFLFFAGTLILQSLNTFSEDSSHPLDDILSSFKGSRDPVNVLVLVGDASSGNTDTILLVNYNPVTAQVNLLTIPRDTRVKRKGHNARVNSAYASGGPKLAVDTVSGLLDVNINYFFHVDIDTFKGIIDKLGGVEFDVPADLKYDDPTQDLHINLHKGKQILDGDKAEQLLRFRKPNGGKYSKELKQYYDGSDLKREDMQQNFIKELLKQKANVFYLTKLNDILTYVFKNVKTNMQLDDALKMSQNIGKVGSNELKSFKISGDSDNSGGAWHFVYNNKILDTASNQTYPAEEIINSYFKATGGFINSVDNNTTKDSESTTKKSTPVKKSVTKKNPSNSESSLKGQKKPAP